MLENKIKELIIEKYGTLSHFCTKIGLPYTTVDSILKRGIAKANVLNVIKICNALEISVDSLKDGIIKPTSSFEKVTRENIADELKQIKTNDPFTLELLHLLNQKDLNEQQKNHLLNTLKIISSDKK